MQHWERSGTVLAGGPVLSARKRQPGSSREVMPLYRANAACDICGKTGQPFHRRDRQRGEATGSACDSAACAGPYRIGRLP